MGTSKLVQFQRTKGKKEFLANVSGKLWELVTIERKFKIFGYVSSGDKVPDVMMTLRYRVSTGRIAIEASRQLRFAVRQNCNYQRCKIGL